ncbi:MAG: hypothetical protein FJ271_30340 [Planctomycetes bacterium]|nr:hypothetical protein [Planctomycetota bacterium]
MYLNMHLQLGWNMRRRSATSKQARRARLSLERLEDRTVPANVAPDGRLGFSETAVATGLNSATAMEIAPDGKLFVAEQGGTLEVWSNGTKLRNNFFQSTPLTVATESERGLLGIAFDPSYASNRFIYVYYTTTDANRHNRVSRFTANAVGDVALAASEVIIWEGEAHASSNHNGGAIHFGADGKLYIATGDNANGNSAQSLSSLHGKILRINSNGTIPSDNPFFNQTTGAFRAIWARGLRNPFTFSFRQGTNEMFINDVGQATWEEINEGAAGANYGWPSTEGDFSGFPAFTRPFYAYDHEGADPNGCAITGGAFYNPPAGEFPPGHHGDYFFADFCGGWINRIDSDSKEVISFATDISFPVDLKVDDAGNLYYLARGSGEVFQVFYTEDQPPSVTKQPADQTTSEGLSATFKVYISGTFPLTYQWQRNDGGRWGDIAGAASSSYTLANAQLSDSDAQFRCVVTNTFGNVTSDAADLTVTPNQPPMASITTPVVGSTYRAGTTVSFSGTGTDPEQGDLAASAFHWEIRFYHNDGGGEHFHPFTTFDGVKSGTFTPDSIGETSPNVWYRVILTVTDGNSAASTVQRDVLPQTVTVTLSTNPVGLPLTLDGQPAPASSVGVVGVQRTIEAPLTQDWNDTTVNFHRWSDGGAASHVISTPTADTIYTATYIYPAGTGTGLSGTYYDALNFMGKMVMRDDAMINFNFGMGAPVAGIAADTFSVRWLGKIQPRFSETYTFFTTSDDGVRLWVNNQLIINNWTNHTATVNTGSIALVAGQKYDIRMEYYDNAGAAQAKLEWASASQGRQVVPQSQLYLNEAPTVATAAVADPSTVSGTTTNLSVMGADDAGEGALTYTWRATSKPVNVPNPTFSSNGTNAAKNGTATFLGDGDYTITVTIRDLGGKTVTGSVNVSVTDTQSTIQPGLRADFFNYNRPLASIPSLVGRTPSVSRIDAQVNYAPTNGAWPGLDARFIDTFVSRHDGLIDIPVTGNYTFYLASNDGSKLLIDGQLLINNEGVYGMLEKSATRMLTAGLHSIHIKYFENDGAAGLRLLWAGPGIAKQIVPAGAFFYQTAPVMLRSFSASASSPVGGRGRAATISTVDTNDSLLPWLIEARTRAMRGFLRDLDKHLTSTMSSAGVGCC